MIIEPPKTLEDFRKVRNSILKLMDNPLIDGSMLHSLHMKLTKVNDKMDELKYLNSKGIKGNPRIIDDNGQATDFYLQDLLKDYKEQLTLTDVSQQRELLIAYEKHIIGRTTDDIDDFLNIHSSNL